jgi:hypothetical protein
LKGNIALILCNHIICITLCELTLKGPQDYRDLMHMKFELHFEAMLRKI